VGRQRRRRFLRRRAGQSRAGADLLAGLARGVSSLQRGGDAALVRRDEDGEGKHYASEHPAYRLLLSEPNREQSSFIFRQRMQAVALLYGNAYAYISRRGNGEPLELIQLPRGSVYPVRANGRKWYVYDGPDKKSDKLDPEDVLHIQGPGLDALAGLSLTNKSKNSMGRALAEEEYTGRFYSNGAEPRVIIEHPKSLSPEASQRLRDSWNTMHQGLENSHRTAVLEEGAKANAFGIDPESAQLLESRKFSIVDVANWLGVPPHLLGADGRTSYASLEQENLSFYQHTLGPWLAQWQQECGRKLLTEAQRKSDSHKIEFMVNATMWMDATARANYLKGQFEMGAINPDEIRSLDNRNPLPNGEGKKYYRPLNLAPVGGEADQAATAFKREVVKAFIADGTVSDVIANATLLTELVKQAGLPSNSDYKDPWLPVKDDTGALVSGEVLKDGEGDVVGGLPADSPEPAEPAQPKEGDNARAARIATRQLLVDATRRMAKRLAVAARKNNKASLYEHRGVMLEALAPAVHAYCATRNLRFSPRWLVAELIEGATSLTAGQDGAELERCLGLLEQAGAEAVIRAIEQRSK
jgi:HK97 family phage portal protein